MTTLVKSQSYAPSAPKVTAQERQSRMSALLKQADHLVKEKHFDEALEKIRKVYEYEPSNMYAKAYEERILTLKLSDENTKERMQQQAMQQNDVTEKIEYEVQKRLAEFYKRQEEELAKKKAQELEEEAKEQLMRKASAGERKELVQQGISALESESLQRIQTMESSVAEQLQQTLDSERKGIMDETRSLIEDLRSSIKESHSADVNVGPIEEKLRKELELELGKIKEQMMIRMFAKSTAERRSIQTEFLEKLKEERRRSEEDIQRQVEEERRTIIQREQQKSKDRAIEAYNMQFVILSQLRLSNGVREALLKGLRIPLGITDEDHANIQKLAENDAYVGAVKEAWSDGNVGRTEKDLLKELGELYEIPQDLQTKITEKVKRDLKVPSQSETILILDDEDYILEFLEAILKQTYETVLTAKSAEQALQHMKQNPPSLLLCDVNLNSPEITGFSFCQRLRSGEYGDSFKAVPFVIMSAVADDFFIKSANQLGAKAYLSKPFTREKLESVVRCAIA
jgi:CheY-like chemotaxis protein